MTDTPEPSFGFNTLVMTRHGPMLANRNDIFVGASLIRLGEYVAGEWDLFRQLLAPGQTVVEVGANIGSHTVPMARALLPGGRLIAFEPQRLIFQTLCANLALNSLPNVTALHCGVGDGSGTAEFPVPSPDKPQNFGGVGFGTGAGERVALMTIDQLALPACHLIKIDVEGMEAAVLRGAADTLRRCRPLLYLENDRRDTSPELIRLVQDAGYKAFWHLPALFNAENFNGVREPLFPNIVSINMFCLPQESSLVLKGFPAVEGPDHWLLPDPAV